MKHKGFTLIELLVVVLIIGILSAVALPQYKKAVEKSRISEMINMVSNMEKASQAWRLAGNTPEDGQDLIPLLDIDYSSVLSTRHCDMYCKSNKVCLSVQAYNTGDIQISVANWGNEACSNGPDFSLQSDYVNSTNTWTRTYCGDDRINKYGLESFGFSPC